MSILVDSCILIDHLRGHQVASRFLLEAEAPCLSQITWIEVMAGALSDAEEARIRALLAAFRIVPVDERVSEETVRIRRTRRLKVPDALILATARVHGLTLATRNTKDFAPGDPDVFVPYALP